MHKISKQISKSNVTDIMFILIFCFVLFSFKTALILCLVLLLFSLNFHLTTFTCWCSTKYLRNLKLVSAIFYQIIIFQQIVAL